ncbi:MAG TPA: hypothetical protein DEP84_18900 [Chloroflexi bacterium]|nr:hypothetical protein [Chloroflexota bacterium]
MQTGISLGRSGVLRIEREPTNTIPGVVFLGVDIRGTCAPIMDRVVGQVVDAMQGIAQERGLQVGSDHGRAC